MNRARLPSRYSRVSLPGRRSNGSIVFQIPTEINICVRVTGHLNAGKSTLCQNWADESVDKSVKGLDHDEAVHSGEPGGGI